jgi:hypothetical protein
VAAGAGQRGGGRLQRGKCERRGRSGELLVRRSYGQ